MEPATYRLTYLFTDDSPVEAIEALIKELDLHAGGLVEVEKDEDGRPFFRLRGLTEEQGRAAEKHITEAIRRAEAAGFSIIGPTLEEDEPRPRARRRRKATAIQRITPLAVILRKATDRLGTSTKALKSGDYDVGAVSENLQTVNERLVYLQGRLDERVVRSRESGKTMQMVSNLVPEIISMIDSVRPVRDGAGFTPSPPPPPWPDFDPDGVVSDIGDAAFDREAARALALTHPPATVEGCSYDDVSVKAQHACSAVGIVTALDWIERRDDPDVLGFRSAAGTSPVFVTKRHRAQMDAFAKKWADTETTLS